MPNAETAGDKVATGIGQVAPAGYYIALRIGFALPLEETNALPSAWVEHYTRHRLMLCDPTMRWAHDNVGCIRWSAMMLDDPMRVLAQARTFGMRYGLTVSVCDSRDDQERSLASFTRSDREFTDLEAQVLETHLTRRHMETARPANLTKAEIEALCMIKGGLRLKEIGFQLNVSESAVKQRLKNAKSKLRAKTVTEAAVLASHYGVI